MLIRPETKADHQAIFEVTKVAFAPMPFGDERDAYLTGELRNTGDLLVSLVAEEKGQIIGHVAFSPATLPCDGRWAALGPISVLPECQKKGIGSALAKEGLAQVQKMGFAGCVLIGNPAVYSAMGFTSGALTYRDMSPELVMGQAFADIEPKGEIVFAPALEI